MANESDYDRNNRVIDQLWKTLMDEFDGDEYWIGLVINGLNERRIKYHIEQTKEREKSFDHVPGS